MQLAAAPLARLGAQQQAPPDGVTLPLHEDGAALLQIELQLILGHYAPDCGALAGKLDTAVEKAGLQQRRKAGGYSCVHGVFALLS